MNVQALMAILLSASLLLTGSGVQSSQAENTVGSRLNQLFQTFAAQAASVEKTAVTTERVTLRTAPNALSKSQGQLPKGTEVKIVRSETVLNSRWCFVQSGSKEGWVSESSLSVAGQPSGLPTKVATGKSDANVYSSYSQSTRVLAQLEKGAELTIRRTAQFGGVDWVYATVKSSSISGWLLESDLNMPSRVTDTDLDHLEASASYVPNYAQLGFVTSNQLNVRTAPGTNFDRVGAYSGGDRIAILETNSGWGRTADGWVYLGYVYYEGQIGANCMIGNVTADQLNIRSGPSTNYPAVGSYGKDDRVMVLEQVYSNGGYWGYTRRGWVSMGYIRPDYIPGTTTPITGFGVVTAGTADVLNAAGTGTKVETLPKGTIVAVLETVKVGDVIWGHIPAGWIDMNTVDMRAVFQQTVVPPAPEMPEPEPTEPTEAPTEPAEAATDSPHRGTYRSSDGSSHRGSHGSSDGGTQRTHRRFRKKINRCEYARAVRSGIFFRAERNLTNDLPECGARHFPGASQPLYCLCGDRRTGRDGACEIYRPMQGTSASGHARILSAL